MATLKKKPLVLFLPKYLSPTNNQNEKFSIFRRKCLDRLEQYFKIIFPSDLKKEPEICQNIFGVVTPGSNMEEDRRMVRSLPNLKVISNHGVGVDHIDLKWAKESNIRIGNTKYIIGNATADMAMALLLASTRKLIPGSRCVLKNEFSHCSSLEFMGNCLTDSTIGILGMGNIGLKIAIRAKAFNMNVVYHNRSQRSEEDEMLVQAKYFSKLGEMLPICDYLVIACPATDETRNLIGWPEFKAMKNTSYLVNIGRGQIVDHDALVKALKTGEIHEAALDVTYPEPLPKDHPLLSLPNVIITPHFGTNTFETRYKMIDLVAKNLESVLEGKPMTSEVIL